MDNEKKEIPNIFSNGIKQKHVKDATLSLKPFRGLTLRNENIALAKHSNNTSFQSSPSASLKNHNPDYDLVSLTKSHLGMKRIQPDTESLTPGSHTFFNYQKSIPQSPTNNLLDLANQLKVLPGISGPLSHYSSLNQLNSISQFNQLNNLLPSNTTNLLSPLTTMAQLSQSPIQPAMNFNMMCNYNNMNVNKINSPQFYSSLDKPGEEDMKLSRHQKILYDHLLENFSDEEDENERGVNLKKKTPSLENIDLNKKVSYMNEKEVKAVNKVVGSGIELRNLFKEKREKVKELKTKISDGNNETIREFNPNDEIINAKNTIMEIDDEDDPELGEIIENLGDGHLKSKADVPQRASKQQNITHATQQSIKLSNLLASRKTSVLFKLFYKEKELKVSLNIIQNKFEKSVMQIDFFIDNNELTSLQLADTKIDLTVKLQIGEIAKEGDTDMFLSKIISGTVPIVKETEADYYLIIHSHNKHAQSILLDEYLTVDSQGNILIYHIKDESALAKLKNILSDMFVNKNRVELSLDSQNGKVESTCPSDEILIKASQWKDLTKEVEELRQFKYNEKKIIEDAIHKKEAEWKFKFKTYYEKIIEGNNSQMKQLKKDKEIVTSDKEQLDIALKELNLKFQTQEKENAKLKTEATIMKERAELAEKNVNILQLNFQDYEKERKENQKKISLLEEQIEKILSEKEKIKIPNECLLNNSQNTNPPIPIPLKSFLPGGIKKSGTSTIRVDDFIIEEIPTTANPGNSDLNEKILELQSKIETFLCIICLSRTRDCLFIDCNHLCCCFTCIKEKVVNKNKKKSKKTTDEFMLKGNYQCPVCKVDNTSFLKIIIA